MKRVTEDHQGRPVRGVASNYLCDLKVGDKVQVIGPFGQSFLMPNHPKSHIVMICTGTGSAPMRAMTEWRRRLRKTGKFEGGKLMLFFGARTREELPYFGPLQSLPKDFIDINLAFSRTPGQPKRYVQDLMQGARRRPGAACSADPNAHFYVCGLKAMEEGVVLALRDVAEEAQPRLGHDRADAEARGPAAPRDVLRRRGREKTRPGPRSLSSAGGSARAGLRTTRTVPYLRVSFAAALASWPAAFALALCTLALALCMVFFGSPVIAALVFSVASLAVSAVALPASLMAVPACAKAVAAPKARASATIAFFMGFFRIGWSGSDRRRRDPAGIAS